MLLYFTKCNDSSKILLQSSPYNDQRILRCLDDAVEETRDVFGSCMNYIDFAFEIETDPKKNSQMHGRKERDQNHPGVRLWLPLPPNHNDIADHLAFIGRNASSRLQIYQLAMCHLSTLKQDMERTYYDEKKVSEIIGTNDKYAIEDKLFAIKNRIDYSCAVLLHTVYGSLDLPAYDLMEVECDNKIQAEAERLSECQRQAFSNIDDSDLNMIIQHLLILRAVMGRILKDIDALASTYHDTKEILVGTLDAEIAHAEKTDRFVTERNIVERRCTTYKVFFFAAVVTSAMLHCWF